MLLQVSKLRFFGFRDWDFRVRAIWDGPCASECVVLMMSMASVIVFTAWRIVMMEPQPHKP